MAKAGEVRVKMLRDSAAAAAEWLFTYYIPSYQSEPRLLGNANPEHVARLNALAGYLKKAGRTKRGKEFTAVLPREVVAAFALATHQKSTSMLIAPHQVWHLANAMRAAAKSRRGRHDLSHDEIEDRVSGAFHVSERMKQEARQKKRYSDQWLAFTRAGGSLLGSNTPLPNSRPLKKTP